MENELIYCVNHFIVDKVRQILHKNLDGSFLRLNLLSSAISDEPFSDSITEQRKEIFFVLVDYERSFSQDFGKRIHENLVTAAKVKDVAALDALLLSGCDLFYEVNDTDTVYDVMMQDADERIRDLSDKYFPGIWNAVRTGDVTETKRLINSWCSTDMTLNGQSLTDFARSTGNDIIIKLIDVTFHTLQLIHAVFAGNEYKVKELLQSDRKSIQLDYRHLHPLGPPVLAYAIRKNMIAIATSLVENGSKTYSLMIWPKDPSLGQLPVLFAAVSNPNLDMRMLQALLPGKDCEEPKILQLMLFEKNNILEAVMKYKLNLTCFKLLVERCGALGICDRNSKCLTARDVAAELSPQFEDYRKIIDDYVVECIQNPDKYPNQRQILALHGYDLSHVTLEAQAPIDSFLSLCGDYQSQIKQLFRSVENNDVKTFATLSRWTKRKEEGAKELFVTNLTWDSREEGGKNPLPLLHRSVIFHRVDIVKMILEAKSSRDSIDFLLDQHKRTALHYASALKSLNDVRDILRDFGASDHVLDRDGRTPLDFLFVQDLASSHKLIQRLRFVDLENEEPDPWKEKEQEDEEDDGPEFDDDEDDSDEYGEDNPQERGPSCVIT